MSRWWPPLLLAIALGLSATLVLHLFHRQAADSWLAFGSHPETLEILEQSLEDQKTLADADPEHRADYRQRFDRIQTLLQRLTILEHSREQLARRYELILLVVFGGAMLVTVGFMVWRARNEERRLEHLGTALRDLAAGKTDLHLGERSRDSLGRIARMIEQTSRRMARDRRRLLSLENLSSWQEAARRHAHEMKTPLTGARLQLERLDGLLDREDGRVEARQAARGVIQELDRLGSFTQEFTSFARLPRPSKTAVDLDAMLAEFVGVFEAAWPNLCLEYSPADLPPVTADRDQLRQVLVNLCDNASLALEGEGRQDGKVIFSAELEGDMVLFRVADNGPGVDPNLQERIFEPYVTTRVIGKGMGLGLAICRKILLDHGGDLELLPDLGPGAVFQLTLPIQTTSI